MATYLPAPQKASEGCTSAVLGERTKKQLRRLPHVFCKWLDLPFAEDANVELRETRESYSFAVRQPDLKGADVVAEAIEIVPGVVKVALRGEDNIKAMLLKRARVEESMSPGSGSNWRARLPAGAVMEAAAASYANGIVTITIPKLPSAQVADAASAPPPPSRCCSSHEIKRSLRCLV